MELTRENLEEMLAARALGALTDPEASQLETALAGDAELRALAVEMDEAAAMLAYAAEPIPPPPSVRERILSSTRIRTAVPRRVESAADGTPENVVAFPVRDADRPSLWRNRIAAIAAVLVIGFAVITFIQLRRAADAASDLLKSNQRVQELEREVTHQRELRDLLASPDSSLVAMNGTEETPAANAKIVYDRKTGQALLVADKLPEAPPGKAYQLWFIVDGKPIPSQVFKPGLDGRGEMRMQVPPEGRSNAIFAVTLEKEAGVLAPEGKIFLKS